MSAGRIRSRALARRLLVPSFLFLLLLVPDSSALGQPPPRHAPDTILVKFSPSALPVDRALAHALVGAHAYKRFKIVEGLQAVRIPPGMHVKEALELYRAVPTSSMRSPTGSSRRGGLPTIRASVVSGGFRIRARTAGPRVQTSMPSRRGT